jgi:hypothetical protein
VNIFEFCFSTGLDNAPMARTIANRDTPRMMGFEFKNATRARICGIAMRPAYAPRPRKRTSFMGGSPSLPMNFGFRL